MPGWPGGLGNRLQGGRAVVDQGLGDRLQAEPRLIDQWKASLANRILSAPSKLFGGMVVDPAMDLATLAGDVIHGRQPTMAADPQTAEFHTDPRLIDRTTNAAGMLTLGAGAIPAEANSLRMGIKARRGGIGDNGGPPLEGQNLGDRLQQGTWKHPISANKLRDRPYEEMTSTTAPVPGQELQDVVPFDLGKVREGDWIVPFLGDRTAGEGALTHVNEMPIDPVLQEGGSDYLRRPGSPLWASDPKVVGDYHKLISRLQGELPKGNSIWGATVGMGPQSLDYSAQTTKTLLNMVKEGAPLTKKAKKAFDDAMRKTEWSDFRAYPDWPGIDNVTDEWLKGAGSARTKIAKLMDTAKFADMGFPNVAAARKANTHPELREDLPFLATGHAVTRVGEGAVQHVRDPLDPHGSYRSQLKAEGSRYEGRLPRLVPGEIMFPSWARRLKPGLNESGKQRAFSMQEVAQKFTKAHLNRIGKFLDSDAGKKLGVAGLIGAGLLTADEAVGIFGTDGSEADRPAI